MDFLLRISLKSEDASRRNVAKQFLNNSPARIMIEIDGNTHLLLCRATASTGKSNKYNTKTWKMETKSLENKLERASTSVYQLLQ